jgi:tetratricopeptide (TPR) repeat protein
LLALVAWAVKGVINGEMKLRKTPLDIPILAFWIVYLLATIFSIDKWHSFWGIFGDPSRSFVSITALIVVYYLIVSTFTLKKLVWMLGAIITSGFIVALWTVLAIFNVKFMPDSISQFAPISLLGSFTGLGMFFSVLLPLVITVIFKIKGSERFFGKLKNLILILLMVFVALILFLIFALFGFVPWIGLLIGVGFFLIYILSQIIRPAKGVIWVPMASFVIILMFLMIGGMKIAKVNMPVEVSPSYKLSLDVAKSSIKHNFLIGSGPGMYSYAFSLYRPQDFNLNPLFNLRFSQGSGIITESVSTIGVTGTVVLILFLLTFISVSLYLLSTGKEKNKIYSLGFFTASLIMLINAVSLSIGGPLLIFGALLGMLSIAVLLHESQTEENYLVLSLKASPKFALAFAFLFMVISAGVVFLFVSVGKIFIADAYAGSAVRETSVNDASLSKLTKAINLYNKEGKYYTQLGQEYMVAANNESMKGSKDQNVDLIKTDLNNAIFATKQAHDMAPKDVSAAEALAQVYENSGLYVADSLTFAEDAYKNAQSLEPNNPNYFIKLGQLKLASVATIKDDAAKKQAIQDAKNLFQQSVDKKQDFDAGYYNLALTQEGLGDQNGAIDSAGKAFGYNRNNGGNDITYAFTLARMYAARGTGDDYKYAEALYKSILTANDKEMNTHIALGLLYEKMKQNDQAIAEYQKVLDILPAGSTDAHDQVTKMINNVKSGAGNLNNAAAAQPTAPANSGQ